MMRSCQEIVGYAIQAKNGRSGKVEDLYFQDGSGKVEFVLMKEGPWWARQRVLLSPEELGRPQWQDHAIPAKLFKEEIRVRPHLRETIKKPFEMAGKYYPNWSTVPGGGLLFGHSIPVAQGAQEAEVGEDEDPFYKAFSTKRGSLRSFKEICRFTIEARNGRCGPVTDLVFEDDEWTIDHLVMQIDRNKRVLIPLRHVQRLDPVHAGVFVDLDCEEIENLPAYKPSAPVNFALSQKNEVRRYDYYGRPHQRF